MSNPNPDCRHFARPENQKKCNICNRNRELAAMQATQAKRAGREDRDAYITLLNLAFETERLTGDEREQRVDAAAAARTLGDLDKLVADLPSRLEMEGKSRAPRRIYRLTAGMRQWRHLASFYWTRAIAFAVLALPLSILIGTSHLLTNSWLAALTVTCVVSGVAGLVATLIAAGKEFNWNS